MIYKEIIDILKNNKQPTITVFGDFSLDKYLYVDAQKDELSLETNLTAYQVSHKKLFAGAGGTITNNLRALGANVFSIGIVGNDGEGFELINCLEATGVDVSFMVYSDERNTGTYIKPMRCEHGLVTEMNRLDIKNFTYTPMHIQEQLIENLKKALDISDAVIICDQYIENNCAAITDYIQKKLSELAREYSNIIWYVDSRRNINRFKNMILKCNHKELAQVFNVNEKHMNSDSALHYSKILYETNGKPIFVTLGENGSTVYYGVGHKIPAFPVEGEIDIVGAGDACNAGIVFALTKGANYRQAAIVGNAASSITIKKIGETGVARLEEVIELLNVLDKQAVPFIICKK